MILWDCLPSLSQTNPAIRVNWPDLFLDQIKLDGGDDSFLAIHERAVDMEKQWKSVASWMMGVAGARHILDEKEGYRYVAHVSAFLPSRKQKTDVARWIKEYPPGVVTAEKLPPPGPKYMPDYLVLRPTNRKLEWAVAEAKGCHQLPRKEYSKIDSWKLQAKNIVVRVRNRKQQITRHLVIATASPLGETKASNRAISIQAWNNSAPDSNEIESEELATEIVAVHIASILAALGLAAHLTELYKAVKRWSKSTLEFQIGDEIPSVPRITYPVPIGDSGITCTLEKPFADLIHNFLASNSHREAFRHLQKADQELDHWNEQRQFAPVPHGQVSLSCGAVFHFPETMNHPPHRSGHLNDLPTEEHR